MSINLAKSRNVFFPEIPSGLGKNSDLFLHFTDLQDEMTRQVVGLFDNDAVLRDALNTAVSVAVTAKGDMVYATGTGWGVLPIGSTNQLLYSVDGTSPAWGAASGLNIPVVSGASTGGMAFYNKTTGWAHLAIGSSGQELLAAATGPVWTSKDANIVVCTAGTTGGMIIRSGGAWVNLAASASGTILTMGASVPSWSAQVFGTAKASSLTINSGTASYVITGLGVRPKLVFCLGGTIGAAASGLATLIGWDDGSGGRCCFTVRGTGTAEINATYCAYISHVTAAGTVGLGITVTAMTATGFTFLSTDLGNPKEATLHYVVI